VTTCPGCERRTPAARGTCLYCGGALPVSQIASAPPQRNIDVTELAFNSILQPALSPPPSSISALASALKLGVEEAETFLRACKPIPVARSQNRQEAEMICALIRTCGLKATVIADEDLELTTELVRARRISLGGPLISVHYSGGELTVPANEINLLVIGSLRKTRVDYSEGIVGSRGKASNLMNTAEFTADETLLDVYACSLDKSFRIKADAFDYSGLANPLSFRAELNLKSGVETLMRLAPDARVDSDFSKVRPLLQRAWPERSRNESRGIRRTGLSFRPVSQQSILSDNTDQFERYSRLMFLFGGRV